jgi:opacity protein-like surface antigen
MVGYGTNISESLSAGLTIDRMNIDTQVDATGWNATIGLRYSPKQDVVYALRVKDIAQRISWDDRSLEESQATFDVGIARSFSGVKNCGRVTVAAAYNEVGAVSWRDGFRFGVEACPSDNIALRAGYAYGRATVGFGVKRGDKSLDVAWANRGTLENELVVAGALYF